MVARQTSIIVCSKGFIVVVCCDVRNVFPLHSNSLRRRSWRILIEFWPAREGSVEVDAQTRAPSKGAQAARHRLVRDTSLQAKHHNQPNTARILSSFYFIALLKQKCNVGHASRTKSRVNICSRARVQASASATQVGLSKLRAANFPLRRWMMRAGDSCPWAGRPVSTSTTSSRHSLPAPRACTPERRTPALWRLYFSTARAGLQSLLSAKRARRAARLQASRAESRQTGFCLTLSKHSDAKPVHCTGTVGAQSAIRCLASCRGLPARQPSLTGFGCSPCARSLQ